MNATVLYHLIWYENFSRFVVLFILSNKWIPSCWKCVGEADGGVRGLLEMREDEESQN